MLQIFYNIPHFCGCFLGSFLDPFWIIFGPLFDQGLRSKSVRILWNRKIFCSRFIWHPRADQEVLYVHFQTERTSLGYRLNESPTLPMLVAYYLSAPPPPPPPPPFWDWKCSKKVIQNARSYAVFKISKKMKI